MDWKPYEPFLHRAMGFGAMLTNTRLLLTRREMKQLPPENDRYPALAVRFDDNRIPIGVQLRSNMGELKGGWSVYWGAPRVMDTLNDSKQYDEGGTVGWFVLVGASMTLGAMLHRWLG